VALLDHDDHWLPEKLLHQMSVLADDRDLEFCATGFTYRGPDDQPPIEVVLPEWDESPEAALKQLLTRNLILTSTVVATRKLLVDVGLFDTSIRWGEEYDLWLRIAAAGYRIGYLQGPLTVYNVSPASASLGFFATGSDPYVPVLERRFAAGDFPTPIQARRRWYLAHRHLNNACGYLTTGHYRKVVSSLAQAFWQRPASARPGWLLLMAKAVAGMIRLPRAG
jgi:hypothetical protein